jgi:hypothetical protein
MQSLINIFRSAFGGAARAGSSLVDGFSGNASGLSLLSGFGSLASSGLQMYASRQASRFAQQRLMMNSQWQDLQAKQIELNAQERANSIRDQLLSDMASTSAFYVARGVDIGSGSAARANIISQRNAAEDIIQSNRQARLDAAATRSGAAHSKTEGRLKGVQGRVDQAKALPGMFKSGAQLYTGLRSLLNG